jgi:hypothetical protein
MKTRWIIPFILVLALGIVVAQEEESEEPAESATPMERTADTAALTDALLRAIRLPEAADRIREMGVPREEVEQVLDMGRERNVPAEDMELILGEEARSVEEYGNIDNFGAFVRSQLDQGLRGRDLAEAIHREHAARGKGKYKDSAPPGSRGKGKGQGKGKGKDRSPSQDQEEE